MRSRGKYLAGMAVVILLGLASRHFHGLFPQVLGKYPGDALWALMVFLGLGCMLPAAPSMQVAVYALTISFAVEASQLYHAPWLDAVRATVPGHLVLGSGFDRLDFLAYAAGACLGLAVERLLVLWGKPGAQGGRTCS